MRGLVIDPILPVPAIAALAALLCVLAWQVYTRVGAGLGRTRSAALLALRLAGLVTLCLLLLQPSRPVPLPPPAKHRVTLVGVDTSRSMRQRDVDHGTRLDAAKSLLIDASVATSSGRPADPRFRCFEFGEDARPVTGSILDLAANGTSTRIHRSVSRMLESTGSAEAANALILLTDGHDFELVNPAKTAAAARARETPIYAVPLGRTGKVRDVSTHITGFQPYCYVRQKARVSAALRLIGCEFEDLTVELLRQGKVVQTKRLNADEFQELPVDFEIVEPEVGQYEYEVRVPPLEHEVDTANNSAITYLNVIDQQIRALIIEGEPYWDTTFLQRSLMRNDKFDVDAVLRYGENRFRLVRKNEANGKLIVPENIDQLSAYDVVFLGRSVDRVLSAAQIRVLDHYVSDRAGSVIFGRGAAFENASLGAQLEPVSWGDRAPSRLRVEPAAEGRGLAAFRALSDSPGGVDALPEVFGGFNAGTPKPLTATLATASGRDKAAGAPAIFHRRHGRGQVVSVGLEGLWRWGLNEHVEGPNTPFDRFWDQMILWLMAGRDFVPARQFSFRPQSANILLGEKVWFRLTMRQPDPRVKSVPLTIYLDDAEVGRVTMTGNGTEPGRLVADYLPTRVGRYRAAAAFPDGTTQDSRFIVFTENLEETEVAADVVGLRRLCEASGGRLVQASELPKLIAELDADQKPEVPRTRLAPVWNQAWVYGLVALLLGLDWFLRRRWGLC